MDTKERRATGPQRKPQETTQSSRPPQQAMNTTLYKEASLDQTTETRCIEHVTGTQKNESHQHNASSDFGSILLLHSKAKFFLHIKACYGPLTHDADRKATIQTISGHPDNEKATKATRNILKKKITISYIGDEDVATTVTSP
jgi:hypothetical protein